MHFIQAHTIRSCKVQLIKVKIKQVCEGYLLKLGVRECKERFSVSVHWSVIVQYHLYLTNTRMTVYLQWGILCQKVFNHVNIPLNVWDESDEKASLIGVFSLTEILFSVTLFGVIRRVLSDQNKCLHCAVSQKEFAVCKKAHFTEYTIGCYYKLWCGYCWKLLYVHSVWHKIESSVW